MLSRWPLPLALVALMVVPASAADQTVTAQPSSQWSPDDVTLDMGDAVTWNNAGGVHNVEFNDGSYTQPAQPDSSNWTAQRTFDTPGIFRYHCGFHGSSMSGVVRVRDATGEVPEPVEVAPGLTLRARDEQGLRRLVAGSGVRARVGCVNGCDAKFKLSLAPKAAERFDFPERRKTIGSESAPLPANTRVPIAIGLTRKARNRLEDAKRPFKVRLDVTATKDTRETARETIQIVP